MSNAEWYLRHSDRVEHGPFELAALVDAATQGNIAEDTEVRHEKYTKGQWVLATRFSVVNTAMPVQFQPIAPPPISPYLVNDNVKQPVHRKKRSNQRFWITAAGSVGFIALLGVVVIVFRATGLSYPRELSAVYEWVEFNHPQPETFAPVQWYSGERFHPIRKQHTDISIQWANYAKKFEGSKYVWVKYRDKIGPIAVMRAGYFVIDEFGNITEELDASLVGTPGNPKDTDFLYGK